jgi:hypothetical protein
MCENRVLRKTSGRERNEVAGKFRKTHSLFLTKYQSREQNKKSDMDGACGTNKKDVRCGQGLEESKKILPITCHEGPEGE